MLVVIPLAGTAHLAVLWVFRELFNRRFQKDNMPSDTTNPKFAEKLKGFYDGAVYPFFERNGIMVGNPIQVPEEEVALLVALFRRRGFGDTEAADWDDFLCACALRSDFIAFRQRIEHFNDADAITVYANLFPNEQSDRVNLPFLREILAQRGQTPDLDELMARVDQFRSHFRLKAFSKDLELRRTGRSLNVTMQQVDAMNPYNFEKLLGMIYEAQGYRVEVTPKSGDQGADVILERAGERVVLQAKLYGQPVGNHAVQEVNSAKNHYRCHRAIVVSNNTFTRAAMELARTNNVELVDRLQLGNMLDEFNKLPKDYERLARLMTPALIPSEPISEVVAVEKAANGGNG